MDLLDMVNSFIDKGYGVIANDVADVEKGNKYDDYDDDDGEDSDVEEIKDSLKRLFSFNGDEARRMSALQVQKACRHVFNDNPSSSDFKMQLMACLFAPSSVTMLYEIRVNREFANRNGKRMTRDPSVYHDDNARVIDIFGKLRDLASRARECVMSNCDGPMKQQRMPVPPWRRHGYVQAKWFGPYKRITSDESAAKSMSVASKEAIGFLSFPGRSCYKSRRQDHVGNKLNFDGGNLGMVMNGAT
ncbi:hypothetical protein Tco_0060457 [Tanacetum coccineum]